MEPWNHDIALVLDAAGKLGLSLLCGFILGYERERHNKPAGLRTIMLITVGSTLFMIVSLLVPALGAQPEAMLGADPGRIAAQIIAGVGFLGAGSIIQARGDVHGLTTAATIWVAAAIGMAIGLGLPLLALLTTAAVLLLLVLLGPLGIWISRRGRRQHIALLVPNDTLTLSRMEAVLRHHNVRASEIEVQPHTPETVRVRVQYAHPTPDTHAVLLNQLAHIEGIRGEPRF